MPPPLLNYFCEMTFWAFYFVKEGLRGQDLNL